MRVWWGSAVVLPRLVTITLKKKSSLVPESGQNSLSGLWPPPADVFPVRLGSAILSEMPSAMIFHRGMTARFYGTMEACQAKTGSDIFLAGNKWAKAKKLRLVKEYRTTELYFLEKVKKMTKWQKQTRSLSKICFVVNIFLISYQQDFRWLITNFIYTNIAPLLQHSVKRLIILIFVR